MYQDWKQWARLVVSCLLLLLVWDITQPWGIALYQQAIVPGWVQVSLLAIGAVLIFPKARRLDHEESYSDYMQLIGGLFSMALGFAASFLP